MDTDPTILLMVLVFSVPTLWIVTRPVTQWLKIRASKKRELDQKVERLEQANADYAQRLENLEAVVVSRTWSALDEPVVATRPHEVHAPAAEEMNRERTARLARRLGG